MEFLSLIQYIEERLIGADDLPAANERHFKFQMMSRYKFEDFIDYYDYKECE